MQGTLGGGVLGRGAEWGRWEQVWQEMPRLFDTEDGIFAKPSRKRKAFPPVRFLKEGDYSLEFSNMGRKPKFNPNPVNLAPIPRTPTAGDLV